MRFRFRSPIESDDDAAASRRMAYLGYTASDFTVDRVWFGILFPMIPAGYGVYGFIAGETWAPAGKGHSPIHVTGTDAYALSTAFLCVGLFFHFKHIWSASERFCYVAAYAQALALIGIIGGLGTYIVRAFP